MGTKEIMRFFLFYSQHMTGCLVKWLVLRLSGLVRARKWEMGVSDITGFTSELSKEVGEWAKLAWGWIKVIKGGGSGAAVTQERPCDAVNVTWLKAKSDFFNGFSIKLKAGDGAELKGKQMWHVSCDVTALWQPPSSEREENPFSERAQPSCLMIDSRNTLPARPR